MKCLCCGKELNQSNASCWHASCIKHFFGTTTIPQIEIDEETIKKLAKQNIDDGITIPGVQKKLSLHLSLDNSKPRLTLIDYPSGFILKPQVDDFTHLPEAEQLVMSMADITGIHTVPHALIKERDQFAYITKRIDRKIENNKVEKIAMEDFCQLSLRLTEDKYKGSYEKVAKIIDKYSCQVGLDLSELFLRLVFCFVTGNSDMHLKNFSLIKSIDGYVLSRAYDLLPVNLIMPEDKEEFALTMNGKKMHIRKKDFFEFASNIGIALTSAKKMINKVVSLKPKYIEMINDSYLFEDEKKRFVELINQRLDVLK